jgi:hypothetical protein
MMDDMSDLQSASRAVKEAFDAYVATIGASADDPKRVMHAMNDLQAAMGLFTDASIDATGWGNPFLPPEAVEEEKEVRVSGVVRVEAEYKVQVTNLHTFSAFVRDRVRKAGSTPHEDAEGPVAQVHELFAVDGWDPFKYDRPDFNVVQSRWSVTPEIS